MGKFDKSARQEELKHGMGTKILIVMCIALALFLIFGINWDWVFGAR